MIPCYNDSVVRWIQLLKFLVVEKNDHKYFRERLFTMFSSFYALILVIMALVLELSRTLKDSQHSIEIFAEMDLVNFFKGVEK